MEDRHRKGDQTGLAEEVAPDELEIADELIAERRHRAPWGNARGYDALATPDHRVRSIC